MIRKLVNPFLEDAMTIRVIEEHELNLLMRLNLGSLKLYVYILMIKIPNRNQHFELRDTEITELFPSKRAFKEAVRGLTAFNIIDIKSEKSKEYWINYKFFTQYGYYHTIGDTTGI